MLICIVDGVFNVLTFGNSRIFCHVTFVSSVWWVCTFSRMLTLQISKFEVNTWTSLILHIMMYCLILPPMTLITLIRLLRYDISLVSLASVAVKLVGVWLITFGILRRCVVVLHCQGVISSYWSSTFSVCFNYSFMAF